MEVSILKYAGIGSRKTPDSVITMMGDLAKMLAFHPTVLRTGGAEGADDAFIRGWIHVIMDGYGMAEMYLPWPNFNGWGEPDKAAISIWDEPSPDAFDVAAEYHPNWRYLKQGAKKLHARNMHIVLGWSLMDPVDFVVCWTPGAKISGGTGQALRVADDLHIPVFNLANDEDRDIIDDAIRENNIDAIRGRLVS
jgi:hypothetical protein